MIKVKPGIIIKIEKKLENTSQFFKSDQENTKSFIITCDPLHPYNYQLHEIKFGDIAVMLI